MPVRVVIAEDNALLRDGLARLISSTSGFELVGTAASYDELLALVEGSNPDVVVTDIRMPPTGTDEGIRAAAALRSSHPDTGVIVLSQYVSPAYAMSLLAQGSERRGYLLKDRVADVDDLVDAIRVVAAGGAVIDPKVVEQLVASSSRKAQGPARLPHATRARGARRDGARQVERRSRGRTGPVGARRREAHQLDLLEAAPQRGTRRQPAGHCGSDVPDRG